MKKFKSHFTFSKQEQSGIFFLLLIIITLQIFYFIFKNNSNDSNESKVILDIETQTKIDSLKKEVQKIDSIRIYPFNPNYITDFKGYTLGMSLEEIDRLHAHRSENKFVNSTEEFQKVTHVSDSLLNTFSQYFKFPEWTQKRSPQLPVGSSQRFEDAKGNISSKLEQSPILRVKDLNTATAEDLQLVSGIGNILSIRIVKFRERLGGFLIDDQLKDVYGLEPEVVQRTLKRFKVIDKPVIEKININVASVEEISQLIYIKDVIAQRIVEYREINGTIISFDELTKIEDFPIDKIHRIKLYLTL
ncbi:MAG: helix-hairpin-helix domain-containing protein [Maribacter sp.]